MWRSILLAIVLASFAPSSALAWGLRYTIPGGSQGWDIMTISGNSPSLTDFESDGIPDMWYMTAIPGGYRFSVLFPDGTVRWQYDIDNVLGAPDGTWFAQFLGFGNLDPSPGREALFGVLSNDSGVYGCQFEIISPSDNTVLWSHHVPGGEYMQNCTFPATLDGDGLDEIVLQVYAPGSTAYCEVWGYSAPSAITDRSAPSTTSLQVRPTPASSGTFVDFNLSAETLVSVRVFDVAGRLVRDLIAESYPKGHHSVRWDGNDGAGLPVTSGVYYARIRVGNLLDTRTIVITR